jgi:hypothetical protein
VVATAVFFFAERSLSRVEGAIDLRLVAGAEDRVLLGVAEAGEDVCRADGDVRNRFARPPATASCAASGRWK